MNLGISNYGINKGANLGFSIDGRFGIYNPSLQSNPVQQLIKSADFYLSPDKADGTSQGVNSPFTNPWVDVANDVGKNKTSSVNIISDSNGVVSYGVLESQRCISWNCGVFASDVRILADGGFKPNVQYTLSGKMASLDGGFVRIRITYTDATTSSFQFNNTLLESKEITSDVGKTIDFISGVLTSSGRDLYIQENTLQLEEGTVATSYEPYAKNNALLTNFAETSSSGYVTETINGKTNTFLNLDGTDDHGIFADNDVLNPVGDDDFAQLVVFRPDDTNARYYGLVRNLVASTDTQYDLAILNVTTYRYSVGGLQTSVTVTHSNALKYILYGRVNGRSFLNLDGVELQESANATSITIRPNTQLGCRSNSADGTIKATFGKGLQGDIAFWKGPNGTLDKDKIVDTVKKAMKYKYGLGV